MGGMTVNKTPAATLAKVLRIFACILSVFVLIEAGIALLLSDNAREKRATWNRAEATVTELERVNTSDTSGQTWRPVFSLPVEGKVYLIRSSSSSNPPAYKVGEKVEMLYPSENPTEAVTNTFWGLYIWPVALFGLAALEGLAVLVLLLVSAYLRSRKS